MNVNKDSSEIEPRRNALEESNALLHVINRFYDYQIDSFIVDTMLFIFQPLLLAHVRIAELLVDVLKRMEWLNASLFSQVSIYCFSS